MNKPQSKKTRKPIQSRGIERQQKILAAAKLLIGEVGIKKTTAYKIAERAELPPASIYQYFPSCELIFEALAELQFETHMNELNKRIQSSSITTWQQMIEMTVMSSYLFYTSDTTNMNLFLGMETTLKVRMGAASRLTRFAEWCCSMLEQRFIIEDIDTLKEPLAISVNIADAVFLRSLSLYGEIRPNYYNEALIAVLGYLSAHINEVLPEK